MFIWITPELFLISLIVILIGFSVIFEKINGVNSQRNKIKALTIASLLFLVFLLFNLIFIIDHLSLNYTYVQFSSSIFIIKLIICLSSLVLFILLNNPVTEILILMLLVTLGLFIIISSNDLIIFYLGLELISLSLYILASFNRNEQYSTEAGLKYLILGALSSGLLLFGSSLIYLTSGKTNYSDIALFGFNDVILIGSIFILIAILFKLASAPFHMWAPDVYEGSPTLITAYFAIVPKIGILYALITFLFTAFINFFYHLQPIIWISALLSILIGSMGAINQTKIKRVLAYSAIGHMGFMLLGLSIGSFESIQATLTYYLIYIIMSINVFTLVTIFYPNIKNTYLANLVGWSRKNPILLYTLALTTLSMAGIPPLAGFLSKYLIIINVIGNKQIIIATIAIILSVISAFYYIRLIQLSFFKYNKDFINQSIIESIKPMNIKLKESIILGSTTYLILTLMFNPSIITNITWEIVNILLI